MTGPSAETATHPMGREILGHIDRLAECSEARDHLTRTYLTDQHRRANALVSGWMESAGMTARIDAVGNVVGRYEGARAGSPALVLGSHLDTVRDAGKYDGILGVITAIACVKALSERGERPDFAIEVVGFGDEEGVRFQSGLIGSSALAGTFDPAWLELKDAGGTRLADALHAFGLDPKAFGAAAKPRDQILAYVEIHIEQGPVLEADSLPVGVVTSISGATRLVVEILGEAGHAGTVPMNLRKDALTAAAEAILAIESICNDTAGLVGTVGQIEALPGAANVIPGKASITVDLRAGDDRKRLSAVKRAMDTMETAFRRRGVKARIDISHEISSCHCTPWIIERLGRAVDREGIRVRELASGAGHDAAAMAAITDIGMLFVRCKGGVSHNAAESISREDAEMGARVLLRFIQNFNPRQNLDPQAQS